MLESYYLKKLCLDSKTKAALGISAGMKVKRKLGNGVRKRMKATRKKSRGKYHYLKNIPEKPLTSFDLIRYVKFLRIPNFRVIFMRDKLPKRIKKHEVVLLIYIILMVMVLIGQHI